MSITFTGVPPLPDLGDPANFNTLMQNLFVWYATRQPGSFLDQIENIQASDYFSIATKAEAEAGASNDVMMTALRTAQAIAEQGVLKANLASFAEYASATAGKVLETDSVWGSLIALTDAATTAVNLNLGYDFGGSGNAKLSLGGNRTLGAPSNGRTGKKGVLWFGASGSTRTLTLHTNWKLSDGVEEGPYSITTTETLGVAYVCLGSTVYVTAILRG